MKPKSIVICLLLLNTVKSFSQGFINLDFESAVIKTNGAPQFTVVASNAIPGWTAYENGVQATYIAYNAVALSAASVDLESTNGPVPQIHGNYYIYLQGSSFTAPASAAIGQTGQIPLDALSLLFWGYAGGPTVSAVSFSGNLLTLNQIDTTANYDIYAADISAYAGQTGQLLFTGLANGGLIVDNIQFSSIAVPEPGELALAALGTLLLGCRRWKNEF